MRLTIPNQLTIIRILLTPVFAYYFLKCEPRYQLIASIIFFVASITDWYDGWYARRFGVITRWGQFMDPLADKILVSTALIIFAIMGYVFAWMVWLIVLRDLFVTGIRIYALYKGTPVVTHIVAKWKTFLQMATIFFILFYVNWSNFFLPNETNYHARYFDLIGISMIVVTILTVLSGIIYVYSNWELVVRVFKLVLLFPFRRR